MSWIRAIFGAIGAFFGWLDHKALMDAGKAMASVKQKEKTVETIKRVNRPVSDSESDRMWRINKAKYGSKRSVREPTDT